MKNTFQGYSSVEILTREAACNDKSYPTLEVMDEVARLTHDSVALHQIMDVLHKRIFYIYRRHVRKTISLLVFYVFFCSHTVAKKFLKFLNGLKKNWRLKSGFVN